MATPIPDPNTVSGVWQYVSIVLGGVIVTGVTWWFKKERPAMGDIFQAKEDALKVIIEDLKLLVEDNTKAKNVIAIYLRDISKQLPEPLPKIDESKPADETLLDLCGDKQ